MDNNDWHEFMSLLGITGPADPDVIDGAYRKAAFKHHPDKGGNPEVMKRLTELHTLYKQDELEQPSRKKQKTNATQEPDLYCDEVFSEGPDSGFGTFGASFYESQARGPTKVSPSHFVCCILHLRELVKILEGGVSSSNIMYDDLFMRCAQVPWPLIECLIHGFIARFEADRMYMCLKMFQWACGRFVASDLGYKYPEIVEAYSQVDWSVVDSACTF